MTMPEARRHSTEEMLRCELAHVRGTAIGPGDVYAAARALELNALCLSGGGIRSASFCLGVLQALAQCGLLRKFDYLSTVSGGGYIGGWLQQLIRERTPGTAAPDARVAAAETELAKTAPAALRRLRDHTNFLTPQTGIGSADTWAGIALYLRNLMLNWMVLLPVFLLAALAPIFHRTAIWWFGQFQEMAWGALILAHLLLACGVAYACTWLPSHCDEDMRKNGIKQARARRRIVVCVLGWATLLPVNLEYLSWWGWDSQPKGISSYWSGAIILVGAFIGALLLGYGLAALRAPRNSGGALFRRNARRWLTSSVGAGALLFILFWVLWEKRDWLARRDVVADVLTIAVPVLLLLVLLAQTTFYLGIRPRALYAELDREWLARLNGTILGIGAGWTLFAAACLIGPMRVIDHAKQIPDTTYSLLLSMGALLAGVSTSLLGRQARSPVRGEQDHNNSANWMRELAFRVLPVLFIVAMFGVLGTFLQYGLGQVSKLWIQPDSNLSCSWENFQAFLASALDVQACSPAIASSPVPIPPQSGTGGILVLQLAWAGALFVVLWFFDGFINVNGFSMHAVYRNRLARAFLGTPRDDGKREPDRFTGFDENDDPRLQSLIAPGDQGQRLFPVINMTMNITAGNRDAWSERQGASFTATPLFCGSGNLGDSGAFVPTRCFAGKRLRADASDLGTHLGSMMTVSGAAASPHMGYHSSPVVAFLMTLFNVRLGAWYPNPERIEGNIQACDPIQLARPRYSLRALLWELMGQARADTRSIYLSDGGHFENLGVYEMIRRRCKRILVIDAACDEQCHYFDLGMAIRKAEIDFPVRIELRTPLIEARAKAEADPAHAAQLRGVAHGTIFYLDGNGEVEATGEIIYVKPSWLPEAPKAVLAYAAGSPAFPHEGTEDQWFSESQFESYRALGKYQMSWVLDRVGFVKSEQPTLGELFTRTPAILAPAQRV